jgi:integrase
VIGDAERRGNIRAQSPSVRKRTWKTAAGLPREGWIVDYADAQGDRHIRTFERKKDADAFHASVNVEVRLGLHTSPNKSPNVGEAADLYLETCQQEGLERTTLDTYRQHIGLHIVPFLGAIRLSELTMPLVREFIDRLRRAGRSPAMVKKIIVRLGSMLADAQCPGARQGEVHRPAHAPALLCQLVHQPPC